MLLSDIHTAISTIEEGAAYFGLLMYHQFRGSINLTNADGVGFTYPHAQHDVFEADDGKQYMRFEYILPLKPDSAITPRHSWLQADQHDLVSPVAFPEGYKDSNLTV